MKKIIMISIFVMSFLCEANSRNKVRFTYNQSKEVINFSGIVKKKHVGRVEFIDEDRVIRIIATVDLNANYRLVLFNDFGRYIKDFEITRDEFRSFRLGGIKRCRFEASHPRDLDSIDVDFDCDILD